MKQRLAILGGLVLRDWILFLADRRAAVLSVAVPVALAALFGTIFHRPTAHTETIRLPLAIVDEDGSDWSRQVVADLRACEQLDVRETDRSAAEQLVESRTCAVALILPAQFAERVRQPAARSAIRPPVELLHHPLCQLEARWVEGLFTERVMRRLVEGWLGKFVGNASMIDRPFDLQRASFPEQAASSFNAYSHSFGGMSLQYLLFMGMESGLLLLRERQRGIWLRLQAGPVSLNSLLTARWLGITSIAATQVLLTFLVGWLVFDVRIEGSLPGFLGLVLAISSLAAATGLLVAALGGNEARARNLSILVILVLSMLGGLWVPSFLLPDWVQAIGPFLPTTWAMHGLDGVTWQGQRLPDLVLPIGIVFASAGLIGLLALARLSWLEARRRRGYPCT